MSNREAGNRSLSGLELQLRNAYRRHDYVRALAAAERLNELIEPKHLDSLYQIARIRSFLGDADEAMTWLTRAVDAGYWDVERLRTDDAFEGLRRDERFLGLVRRSWVRGYIAMLEREEREAFQKPDQVMEALALKAGERVADVGAGSGYFTLRVARAVGPTGIVWAIDIFQEMLDHIADRLRAEKLENVRLVKSSREDPCLPPEGADTILMIDSLHYVQDRICFARKLRAGLAPGGRVVLIDYVPKPWEDRPWGPPPEQQIPRATIDAEMAGAGLAPTRTFDFLPEQYFVVFRVA